MAVREEEQQHIAAGLERPKPPWTHALGHLPALLIAGGLVLYGYLSICYSTFYGRLGVDPNDVGLSYTGTLARSSGFVAAYLAVGFFTVPSLSHVWRPGASRNARIAAKVLSAVFLMALGLALGYTSGLAGNAARLVKAGEPVHELQLPLGPMPADFILLAIHADPAVIEPAGKPGDFPAVERLRGLRLLYLGQSGGTVVLYRPDAQEAVYVPASSIVLHVLECSDELTGPPC